MKTDDPRKQVSGDIAEDVKNAVEQESAAFNTTPIDENKNGDAVEGSKIKPEEIEAAYHQNQYGDADLAIKLFRGKYVHDNTTDETYRFNCTHFYKARNRELVHDMRQVSDLYAGRGLHYAKAAKELDDSGNKEEGKRLKKLSENYNGRAWSLRDYPRVNKVIKLATSGPDSLGISGDEWNRHTTLLPCANCVIDLETGKKIKASPDQFFNKASPIEYRGLLEEAELWDQILARALRHQEDLIEYFGYFAGSAATGIQTKDFFCAYGPGGNNGKSLIFDWMAAVLGDFSGTIRVESLLEEKQIRASSGASPDVLEFRGLRLAVTSEAQRNHRFSLANIKRYTAGGDRLKARGLYSKESVEFDQTHTLLLHSNFLPKAEGNDNAFYDRLKVLPFKAKFIRPDEGPERPDEFIFHAIPRHALEKSFRDIAPAILSWFVRNAKKFLERGGVMPQAPPCVLAETNEYREEQDLVGQFLRECCDADPDHQEQMKDLYDAFHRWCIKEMRIPEKHVKSMKALAGELKMRPGIERMESRLVHYRGLRVLDEWRSDAAQAGQKGLF